MRQRAEAKIADIDERIRALRTALKRLAENCTGRGPVSECPILKSMNPKDVSSDEIVTVELVYDEGCPNVAETRANLLRAFHAAGQEPHWIEWSRSDQGRRRASAASVLLGSTVAILLVSNQ